MKEWCYNSINVISRRSGDYMNQIFCDAIHNRNILNFTYHGYPRIVEIYAYGLSKEGNEVIRCYQIGGSSDSGHIPFWRLFEVSEIKSLTVTREKFPSGRSGYRRGDRGMSRIYCEL